MTNRSETASGERSAFAPWLVWTTFGLLAFGNFVAGGQRLIRLNAEAPASEVYTTVFQLGLAMILSALLIAAAVSGLRPAREEALAWNHAEAEQPDAGRFETRPLESTRA